MFQFPAAPTVGQVFTPIPGVSYRWSGVGWVPFSAIALTKAEADTLYAPINGPQLFNKIQNGGFAIDQRNAGAQINVPAGPALFGPDRWQGINVNGTGVFSIQPVVETLPGADSGYNFTTRVVTQDATLAANELYVLQHRIEGYNIADLLLGTASARPFTLAFDIAANTPGLYTVTISNAAGDRVYVATFTINVPSVYETKIITIPGVTTGAWGVTNGIGMVLEWCLAAGSSYIGTPNVWGTVAGPRTVAGAANFMSGAAGTQLILRNVRLWRGAQDFGMGSRTLAEELQICKRYYQQIGNGQGSELLLPTGVTGPANPHVTSFFFPGGEMRSAPNITFSGGAAGYFFATAGASAVTAMTFAVVTAKSTLVSVSFAAPPAAGAGFLVQASGTTGRIKLSAEI